MEDRREKGSTGREKMREKLKKKYKNGERR